MDMQDALDDLVVRRGLIAAETLARARLVQAETGERIDSVLTRLGLVSEHVLATALAAETGLRIAEAAEFPAAPIAEDVLSARFLRDAKVVPLRETEDGVEAALANPLDPYPIDALAFALQKKVIPLVARAGDIETALDRLYAGPAADDGEDGGVAEEADVERLKDLASRRPGGARGQRADRTRRRSARLRHPYRADRGRPAVRLRIDGVLRDDEPPPPAMRAAVVSRIKIMAKLDIAERRLPQDGRIRLAVRGQEIDLRVSTVADASTARAWCCASSTASHLVLDFAALGFDRGDARAVSATSCSQPHGILLVTGPTGSGKTTTLYAALLALNTAERKILTIEDPVEYQLAGINQMQVKPQIGLTFARRCARSCGRIPTS